MTNEEFAEWRERNFKSVAAAAAALELDRDTIKCLETGVTRNGSPYPIKKHIELMCAAVDDGRLGGSVELTKTASAARLREIAHWLETS